LLPLATVVGPLAFESRATDICYRHNLKLLPVSKTVVADEAELADDETNVEIDRLCLGRNNTSKLQWFRLRKVLA
jgi:hypothetical protein